VLAGILTLTLGSFVVDPIVALVIAGVIIVPTLRTIAGSHRDLIFPENVSCGHATAGPAARPR
jgi:Co/Zn/Cd efflux system component